MANATSGWMPTITVSAPRNRIMWAIPRSVRTAKESMTSSTVTSTMAPRDRYRPTCSTRSSRRWRRSSSLRADWMEAMRKSRCLRMGTRMGSGPRRLRSRDLAFEHHFVAEQALRLLDPSLEVAHRVDLSEVHADGDQGLGDLRRAPGADDVGPHEPARVHGLDEVVGHRDVHRGHPRDVHHHDLRPVGPDAAEELLGELSRALGIDDADDGQDEQPVPHLEHGRRELADGLLLLPDDALPFLDEAHRHRVGDAVGRGLVGVEHRVQEREVALVLLEERSGEDVPEEEHD